MERERRRTPRYVFFASAELLEVKSEVRVASRVSELSLHGCYLDMMNPFPKDTQVLLRIWTDEKIFQTKGRVIYSQPNMGAGVAFLDMEPMYLAILQQWLDDAAKKQ
ncbi:MAG TPA: PilZ domain-containing protein [Candidatus Dormibacteraeota bacterium]|nr:PilZ domain-containing protein [Candidatus Dormibacteraeota bacterium]